MEKEFNEYFNELKTIYDMNRREKNDSWKTLSIEFLEKKMIEEFVEYFISSGVCEMHLLNMITEYMFKHPNEVPTGSPIKESLDIGLIAMMLYHRNRKPQNQQKILDSTPQKAIPGQ